MLNTDSERTDNPFESHHCTLRKWLIVGLKPQNLRPVHQHATCCLFQQQQSVGWNLGPCLLLCFATCLVQSRHIAQSAMMRFERTVCSFWICVQHFLTPRTDNATTTNMQMCMHADMHMHQCTCVHVLVHVFPNTVQPPLNLCFLDNWQTLQS